MKARMKALVKRVVHNVLKDLQLSAAFVVFRLGEAISGPKDVLFYNFNFFSKWLCSFKPKTCPLLYISVRLLMNLCW